MIASSYIQQKGPLFWLVHLLSCSLPMYVAATHSTLNPAPWEPTAIVFGLGLLVLGALFYYLSSLFVSKKIRPVLVAALTLEDPQSDRMKDVLIGAAQLVRREWLRRIVIPDLVAEAFVFSVALYSLYPNASKEWYLAIVFSILVRPFIFAAKVPHFLLPELSRGRISRRI